MLGPATFDHFARPHAEDHLSFRVDDNVKPRALLVGPSGELRTNHALAQANPFALPLRRLSRRKKTAGARFGIAPNGYSYRRQTDFHGLRGCEASIALPACAEVTMTKGVTEKLIGTQETSRSTCIRAWRPVRLHTYSCETRMEAQRRAQRREERSQHVEINDVRHYRRRTRCRQIS